MIAKTLRGAVLRTFTAALAAAVLPGASAADDRGRPVLHFETMAPIDGDLVGRRLDVLRGQAAGGLPWAVSRARGTLHADGRLQVEVRGLVLADDPRVPPARRLTNPVPTFRAVVSCVTSEGALATSQTPAVSASTDGDAVIHALVDPPLPRPCLAPVVFVGNGAGQQQDVGWFAVTGTR